MRNIAFSLRVTPPSIWLNSWRTRTETKTAGLDVELKASDWKLEGQNIVGVISVLRGPKPGDKIRIEIPSEDHRKGPMVDGKPTRSVLTALCQRVAMRLGG
jgi:hypothetical protein